MENSRERNKWGEILEKGKREKNRREEQEKTGEEQEVVEREIHEGIGIGMSREKKRWVERKGTMGIGRNREGNGKE